jgi:hypothetical protein
MDYMYVFIVFAVNLDTPMNVLGKLKKVKKQREK